MIYHTLTNLQLDNPIHLQSYIDNRESDKKVGLRSITYWVGWYNVIDNEYISTESKKINLEPGLYNFDKLKEIFSNEGIELTVDKTNGIITLESNKGIVLSDGLMSMLSIRYGHLDAGQYKGDKMVDFAKPKELHIYLDQINTSRNYINGASSALLAIIPVSTGAFGKAVFCRFECPVFKQLTNGCITELSVRITDENNTAIDNHGLPITIELLIQ